MTNKNELLAYLAKIDAFDLEDFEEEDEEIDDEAAEYLYDREAKEEQARQEFSDMVVAKVAAADQAKAEAAAKARAEEERRLRAEEEAKRMAEEERLRQEAERKAKEEEARRKEEEAKKKAEQEEARRKEQEAKKKAEEARRKEEEAKKKAEEAEAKKKAEPPMGDRPLDEILAFIGKDKKEKPKGQGQPRQGNTKSKKANRQEQQKKKELARQEEERKKKREAEDKELREREARRRKEAEEEKKQKEKAEKEAAEWAKKQDEKFMNGLSAKLAGLVSDLEQARDDKPSDDDRYDGIRKRANEEIADLKKFGKSVTPEQVKQARDRVEQAEREIEAVTKFKPLEDRILEGILVNVPLRVKESPWLGAKGAWFDVDIPEDLKVVIRNGVYNAFHNEEIPGHADKDYPGKTNNTRVCYYVTRNSKSGASFDVSGHVWVGNQDLSLSGQKSTVFVLHFQKKS